MNNTPPETVNQCRKERGSYEIFTNQSKQWFVKNPSSAEGIWFEPNGDYIGFAAISQDDIMIEVKF